MALPDPVSLAAVSLNPADGSTPGAPRGRFIRIVDNGTPARSVNVDASAFLRQLRYPLEGAIRWVILEGMEME